MSRLFSSSWGRWAQQPLYTSLTNHYPSDTSDDDLETEKPSHSPWSRRWHTISSPLSTSSLHSLFLLLIAGTLRLLRFFLPSFIPPLYRRFLSRYRTTTTSTPPARPLHPTAYLDGLRGVAALIVYVFHFTYLWFPALGRGYAATPEDSWFFQTTIVRVLHSGRASVTIFFVISGLVLTLKTVTAIHSRHPDKGEKVLDGLAGSLFRRPFRLYLPILVSTFLTAVGVRFEGVVWINKPGRMDTWEEQFWDWWGVQVRLINPFQVVKGRENIWEDVYNGNLWTIPTEFKGSVMVFVLLLAFARSKRWVHILGVVGAGYWQAVEGDLDMTLFCAGLLFAEMGLVFPGAEIKRIGTGVRHVVTLGVFFLAMHLMSYPESQGPSSPGFRTLSGWVPAYYQGNEDRIQQFWISVGSIMFVWALMYSPSVSRSWWRVGRRTSTGGSDGGTSSQLELDLLAPAATDDDRGSSSHQLQGGTEQEPLLQKLFTTDFSQYLGKVSYSLYLWQIPIQNSVCWRYLHYAREAMGATQAGAVGLEEGGFADEAATVRAAASREYTRNWAWAFFVNTVVLFWSSDLFHRAVDAHAVRFTRKLSTWALAKK